MSMKAKFIQAIAIAGLALPLVAQQAKADIITFNASPKTGDPSQVKVTMDNTTHPGKITVKVDVIPLGPKKIIGDINGVYFDLPKGVGKVEINSVSGGPVTSVVQGTNVNNLEDGVNMNGGEGYDSFNVGLRIGSSGGATYKGKPDDYQTTTFTISEPNEKLSLADFAGLEFGVRLKSVGPTGARTGSSKIGISMSEVLAQNPSYKLEEESEPEKVPEPTTLGGLALGMGVLMKWRSQKQGEKI